MGAGLCDLNRAARTDRRHLFRVRAHSGVATAYVGVGTMITQRVSPVTVALGALVLGYLILPNFITVPLSFSPTEFYSFPPTGFSLRWYHRFFEDYRWTDALARSVRIGVVTAVL